MNICIRNHSNKVVKKIKAMVQQGVDISVFQNGQFRSCVAQMETSYVFIPISKNRYLTLIFSEGCPVQPGSSLQKVMYLKPSMSMNKDRRGIALDGQLKHESSNLASTTL